MMHTNILGSGDRFIPRRACVDLDFSYYKLCAENGSFDFDQKNDVFESSIKYMNHAQSNFRKKIYEKRLLSLMSPSENRILNFSDPLKKSRRSKKQYVVEETWPVKPRKRPLIGPPSIVLDMPDLNVNICHNIIDWSSKGYLATVYENEVHLWHSENRLPYVLTNTNGRVRNCVKWNKDGTQFAMAIDGNGFAIWDLLSNKIIHWRFCFCVSARCGITAMEWSPDGFLLTGCSNGKIIIWFNEFLSQKSIYGAHNGAVINMKFSCQGRYLVTTGIDCKVRLYIWSQMKEYFEINCHEPIKSIAWHPWKDSLLGLSEYGRNGCINLWDVNSQKESIYPSPVPNDPIIDGLTWNSITGELCLSHQVMERNIIVVLSNVNKITDAIEYHMGRVPYLMWGDDGMKLATASTDETLCIWDFFGNSEEKQRTIRKIRAEKKKFSEDPFDHLNIFGCRIR